MRENGVKRKLLQGGTVLGTFVLEFNTTGIARLAAGAGAEFVVFDCEHTGWSLETVRTLMASAGAADLVPMVRVPALEYHFLARALDVGAMGLMVPMVESEDQARLFVQCAKYPPEGRRGAAFGVAHDDYTGGDVPSKMRQANEEQLLVAQIETVPGLESVDAIARVEGIDVLWVGHFDLTSSMGIPGDFTRPEFQRALDRVVDAATRHGKVAAMMASSVDEARGLLERGFRCLAYGGDLWIYQKALRDALEALRKE
ncbi:MAG: aldolase/citrate lyase family protein [Planctomycetota bacterium]|nr:aldolase/citrate lyase family protein [Planctomycetota bacterium]